MRNTKKIWIIEVALGISSNDNDMLWSWIPWLPPPLLLWMESCITRERVCSVLCILAISCWVCCCILAFPAELAAAVQWPFPAKLAAAVWPFRVWEPESAVHWESKVDKSTMYNNNIIANNYLTINHNMISLSLDHQSCNMIDWFSRLKLHTTFLWPDGESGACKTSATEVNQVELK